MIEVVVVVGAVVVVFVGLRVPAHETCGVCVRARARVCVCGGGGGGGKARRIYK
jgi:hypothetical protein